MNNLTTDLPVHVKMSEWEKYYEWPTYDRLRFMRRFENRLNLAGIFKKIGRDLYIDLHKFEEWMSHSNYAVMARDTEDGRKNLIAAIVERQRRSIIASRTSRKSTAADQIRNN